ncbi:MAG: DUF222 domain-containing protein [Actinomycetes bacterium]
MFDGLLDAEEAIDATIAGLDVACIDILDLRQLVRISDRLKRKITAMETLGVGEIARRDAWDDGTAKSAEEWVAKATGASWGEAVRAVELGERLQRMPDTVKALTEGRISQTQAVQIATGAVADPHAEHHLLHTAQHSTVQHLTAETKRVVARATDHAQSEQDRVHRNRFVRFGVQHDGAWTLEARLTKVAGAKVEAALEQYAKVEFDAARKAGTWASHDTYLADGLVAMCDVAQAGGRRRGSSTDASTYAGETSGPLALVEVRVDHAALVRGTVEGDEVCEIEGIGPIPVSEATRLASDSILRVLLVKGGVVQKISNTTRSIPSRLRRALEDRDRVCVVPGCDVSWNLEIDHRVPFAQGGPTDEENLARLCHAHHRDKTARRAILERWTDEHGKPHWVWYPTSRPDQPRPPTFEELWPDTGTG